MPRTRLKREMGQAALGGKLDDAVKEKLQVALVNYHTIRDALRRGGFGPALQGKRVLHVRVGLTRGATIRVWLATPVLVSLHRPRAETRSYPDNPTGIAAMCHDLSRRVNGDLAMLERVLAGIERARQTLFKLAEEGTRLS